MKEELTAIKRNDTWELINFLYNKKDIKVKWVFKLQYNPNWLITKHKSN